MFYDLLPLAIGIFLAQASPGPNLMAVSAAALAHGRTTGVLTAAGIALGVLMWAGVFAIGMGALLSALPWTVIAMKLLGGGYLMFLALRALRTALLASGARAAASTAPRRAPVLTGLLVVLTNPKAMLMWVAVSAYLTALEPSALVVALVSFGAALSAFGIYGSYAFLFSTARARISYQRLTRPIEAAFGLVFGALGARLIVDGIRETRP